MRAIVLMFDSLNRHMLPPYGDPVTQAPNFARLAERAVTLDNFYAGSMPCMPARRELHTGRYNFLHRSWGPLEPFDDSVPQLLGEAGVHTHLASDHPHYWEDGGGTYHTRFTTWEFFRGQEGDPWKGVVQPGHAEQPFYTRTRRQDEINRTYMPTEAEHSQTRTVDAGLHFMQTNAAADNWMLQIELFDPHEPFFTHEAYKARYPHQYDGPLFDWPRYQKVTEPAAQVEHARYEYAALVSMCDHSLGRVLDLMDGSTVQVSDWGKHAAAILEGWFLGQAGGGAIADLLVGRANPLGRLAETIPLRLPDNPSHLNFPGELGVVRYGEGVFVGYRGYDAREQEVSYPFGHGLSYTSFGYTDLDVVADAEQGLIVSATVTNTGSRAGKEVVQVYVSAPAAVVARPVRELKAFAKVALEPGESQRMTFDLTRRDLSYFHPREGRWVLEGGEFGIAVGASSRDLRLSATVAVTAPAPVPPLAEDASLEEWLAHPVGSRLLEERLAAAGPNMLTDPEMHNVVGNFPLARLATFPGMPLTPADVEDLRKAAH